MIMFQLNLKITIEAQVILSNQIMLYLIVITIIQMTQRTGCTVADVATTFEDIPFVAAYSRNHMKQKGKRTPRPRFHVYSHD